MDGYGPAITLPSGRVANVRTKAPTGRDLLAAARAVPRTEPPVAGSMALIAQLVLIDGSAVSYEDVLGLSVDDIDVLTVATGIARNQVPTSAPTSSQASSGTDSGLAN
jgi:hypothetical protein